MKTIYLFITSLLICTVPASAEHLTFAPLPMETPYTVASQWKPFLNHLESRLKHRLKIHYSSTNDEVVEKFKAGKIDLAYLGPLPYLTLKQDYPDAEPIIIFHEKNGRPKYRCAIVVASDSDPQLYRMNNKRIALTQPLSTCGFFAVDGILKNAGSSVRNNKFRYLGPHDEVALAVVRGEYDSGGLKSAIAAKYAHLGLKVIAESPAMPGLALVANKKTLTDLQIEQIRETILEADKANQMRWGDNIRHGVSAASDKIYDEMRRIPLPDNIPVHGNF